MKYMQLKLMHDFIGAPEHAYVANYLKVNSRFLLGQDPFASFSFPTVSFE